MRVVTADYVLVFREEWIDIRHRLDEAALVARLNRVAIGMHGSAGRAPPVNASGAAETITEDADAGALPQDADAGTVVDAGYRAVIDVSRHAADPIKLRALAVNAGAAAHCASAGDGRSGVADDIELYTGTGRADADVA